MTRKIAVFLFLLCSALAWSDAPAPFPIEANSQSRAAREVWTFRNNTRTFRVTYKDGTNTVNITGATPFMSWATNEYALGILTSSYSVVSATGGVVDFTFQAAALNYASQTNIYEVGVAGTVAVYCRGRFLLLPSPYATGTNITPWTTNQSLSGYSFTGQPWIEQITITTGSAWEVSGTGTTRNIQIVTNAGGVASSGGTVTNILSSNAIITITGGAGPQTVLNISTSSLSAALSGSFATGTPLYVEADTNALAQLAATSTVFESRIDALESGTATLAAVTGYTNRSASALSSSVWSLAESTTGYASRVEWIGGSNSMVGRIDVLESGTATLAAVAGYTNRAAAALSSSVWASADSTTNYASRVEWLGGSNSLAARAVAVEAYTARVVGAEAYTGRAASALASSTWAAADSTTNYASRVEWLGGSNSLATRATALEAYTSRIVGVEAYTNRAASALSSSTWAAADSTTNYASRVEWLGGSNSLATRLTGIEAYSSRVVMLEGYSNRAASALSSSIWASSQSVTDSVRRINDHIASLIVTDLTAGTMTATYGLFTSMTSTDIRAENKVEIVDDGNGGTSTLDGVAWTLDSASEQQIMAMQHGTRVATYGIMGMTFRDGTNYVYLYPGYAVSNDQPYMYRVLNRDGIPGFGDASTNFMLWDDGNRGDGFYMPAWDLSRGTNLPPASVTAGVSSISATGGTVYGAVTLNGYAGILDQTNNALYFVLTQTGQVNGVGIQETNLQTGSIRLNSSAAGGISLTQTNGGTSTVNVALSFQPTGAVLSIANTGAVLGAITFAGGGVTQTGTTFNFASGGGGGGDVYLASNNVFTGVNIITNDSATPLAVHNRAGSTPTLLVNNHWGAGSAIGLVVSNSTGGNLLQLYESGVLEYNFGSATLLMSSNAITGLAGLTPVSSNGSTSGSAALPWASTYSDDYRSGTNILSIITGAAVLNGSAIGGGADLSTLSNSVTAVGLTASNAAAGVVQVGLTATNAAAGVVQVGITASNAVQYVGVTNQPAGVGYVVTNSGVVSLLIGTNDIAGGGSSGPFTSTNTASIVPTGNLSHIIYANADYSLIAGGIENEVNSDYAAVIGGRNNTIETATTFDYCAIVGGQNNRMYDAGANLNWSFMGGGVGNELRGAGNCAYIIAGTYNKILGGNTGQDQGIVGGQYNTIYGSAQRDSIILGGNGNSVTGSYSAERSAVLGGYQNNIGGANPDYGLDSVICGGEFNHNGGIFSFVTGDSNDIDGVSGELIKASFAAGKSVRITNANTFVWSDGNLDAGGTSRVFASTSSNQFLICARGGVMVGTNAHTDATVPDNSLTVAGDIYGNPDFLSMGMPSGGILALVTNAWTVVTNFNAIDNLGITANTTSGVITIPHNAYYQINHGMSAIGTAGTQLYELGLLSNGTIIGSTRLTFSIGNTGYEVGRTLWNKYFTNGTLISLGARTVSMADTITFTNCSVSINRLN